MKFDIAKLKSISSATLSTINAAQAAKSNRDDRFWTLKRDQNGNGQALIRILPSLREGELPFVEQWNYSIKFPHGYYIETSLKTFNQPDPMAEYISQKWSQAVTETQKNQLRSAGLVSPRRSYVANILVVDDKGNPANNGKVFLWRFGQKIFEKITDASKPDVFNPESQGTNVVDWDNGCNLALYAYVDTKTKFVNYDRSKFQPSSSIGSDARIIEIADQMYDLSEFSDPSKYKNYQQLSQRLNQVVYGNNSSPNQTTSNDVVPNNQFQSTPRAANTIATNVDDIPAFDIPAVQPTAQSQLSNANDVIKPVVPPTQSNNDLAPWQTSSSTDSTEFVDDFDFDKLMEDIK